MMTNNSNIGTRAMATALYPTAPYLLNSTGPHDNGTARMADDGMRTQPHIYPKEDTMHRCGCILHYGKTSGQAHEILVR